MTTFADMSRPLALLRLLAADHPNLPGINVQVSSIYPDQLTLSAHGDLGAFDVWREALGIDSDSVTRHLQAGDTTAVLRGATVIAEARVELVGYAPNLTLVAKAA